MQKKIKVNNQRPGIWQDTNVTYAQVPGWLGHTTQDLKMSIMRPFESHQSKKPVILWFGGGGWMTVDHNAHLPNFTDLVRKGYVLASAQYRNSNEAQWPAQLEDAKAAVRYLKANANKYDIDPNKIIVMGESAGGHLASMTAVTNGAKKYDVGQNLDQNSQVAAAIPWYGVVNLLSAKKNSASNDFDFVYRNILGADPETHPELVKASDPKSFVTDKTVPFLIFHGTNDEVVPVKDSEALYQTLEKHHVPAGLYELEDAEHMDEAFMQPEIQDLILKFLDKNLKK